MAADPAPGAPLRELAERAGIALHWSAEGGQECSLSVGPLQAVLTALGHACDDAEAIAASMQALDLARARATLFTARLGERIDIPVPHADESVEVRLHLTLESTATREWTATVRTADDGPPVVSLDAIDEPGYHRLTLSVDGASPRSIGLAIAPLKAFEIGPGSVWGTSVQVHGLRRGSTRSGVDTGIGDFGALATFAESAGAAGADLLAISPTHAGFAADATGFSPYSPSSRLFHNVLFIDPTEAGGEALAREAARVAGIEAEAAHLADGPLIDWPTSAALKLRWLRALFDLQPAVDDLPLPDALRLHATFEALHAHFHAEGRADPQHWPAAFRDPASAEVAAFVAAHLADIRFHAWLQALATAGLRRAQRSATAAGMRIGLVSDLAIGMTALGSHAWASRGDLLEGLEIGAPPDMMNAKGQRWGLTTFAPLALLRNGYAPFIETLRAAMAETGGVRIDHVLGLNRLWLVPTGAPASDGAYVHYPLRDLLNLLILESHRHRAIVIGEDLGTVPPGFRDLLAEAGILGMSVLWLERTEDGAGFKPPRDWSPNSVAMTTTHDLPTVAGWWAGRDIDWRERIGTEADPAAARAQRAADREALAAIVPARSAPGGPVTSVIEAIAEAPAGLMLIPVEDLLGLVEQPNLPGTLDEHPNWRRRLPLPADRLLGGEETTARLERLRQLRPR